MKKVTEDIIKALDRSIEALSLNELSRRTGIGIYTLRKFATRQTNHIKEETWDKIYPVLKPYLIGADEANADAPIRIGATARRHHDLVDLASDHKILLDVFAVRPAADRSRILRELAAEVGKETNAYELGSLNSDENTLLGLFDALEPARRESLTLQLVDEAVLVLKKQRRELF